MLELKRAGAASPFRLALAAAAAVLLAVCYAQVLWGMAGQWSADEDMGHGWAVPAVALYVAWRERARWSARAGAGSWWGLALLGMGAAMHAASAAGAGLFAGSVAFWISVCGLVAAAGGLSLLYALAFPLLLLLFMLPKLAVVYNQATLPLQLIATRLAEAMLGAVGLAVSREGNILELGAQRLAVVEACSGIRYLLSLGFIAVVFAWLSDPRPWMRVALLAATAPLAVVANGARVAAMAAFPVLLDGTPHFLAGWLVFIGCLAALAGLRTLIGAIAAKFPGAAANAEASPAPAAGAPLRGGIAVLALIPVVLAAQTGLVAMAGGAERVPAAPDLSGFPKTAGEWNELREDPIGADVVAGMGADRILSRTYVHASSGETAGLLVAWFQSQRGGVRQPHSPKVCLPASGWVPEATGEIEIPTALGRITVNRYLVANRSSRLAVLYWYQSPRRVIAGEWEAKILLVADALRDRRTDIALVRVITHADRDRDQAVRSAAAFAARIYPLLRTRLPGPEAPGATAGASKRP